MCCMLFRNRDTHAVHYNYFRWIVEIFGRLPAQSLKTRPGPPIHFRSGSADRGRWFCVPKPLNLRGPFEEGTANCSDEERPSEDILDAKEGSGGPGAGKMRSLHWQEWFQQIDWEGWWIEWGRNGDKIARQRQFSIFHLKQIQKSLTLVSVIIDLMNLIPNLIYGAWRTFAHNATPPFLLTWSVERDPW